MSEVPDKVKEIVNTAVNKVYAKDVEKLDTAAKETLDKVLNYVERKYISVPMKIAKEVLLDKSQAAFRIAYSFFIMGKNLIIGSRGSDLALWQANFIQDKLSTLKIPAEIKVIKTQGEIGRAHV